MGIDTLRYARHLEDAGVDRKIAEAHAEAIFKFVDFSDFENKKDAWTLHLGELVRNAKFEISILTSFVISLLLLLK